MKKLFVLFLFMGFIISQADADTINPKITHVFVASEDDPEFPTNIPLSVHPPTPEAVSGGHSADGIAFRFNLAQDMVIKSIMAPVAVGRGIENNTPVPGTWKLNFSLFSGSTNQFRGEPLPDGQLIPLVGHRLLNQDFMAVGHDLVPASQWPPIVRTYTYQGVGNLDINVPAGDYWVGVYRGDGVA